VKFVPTNLATTEAWCVTILVVQESQAGCHL